MEMVTEQKNLYQYLGEILRYPHEDILPKIDASIAILSESKYPEEILKELRAFRKDVERLTLDGLQELYTYTFEFSSDTTLDMGYYAYEGFKRARNLLTIKSMYRDREFPFEELAKGELPDNLSVLLQFIGFLKDENLKKDFVKSYVIMSMEKLDRNFQMKRNAYRHLINATYKILDTDIKDTKEVN